MAYLNLQARILTFYPIQWSDYLYTGSVYDDKKGLVIIHFKSSH